MYAQLADNTSYASYFLIDNESSGKKKRDIELRAMNRKSLYGPSSCSSEFYHSLFLSSLSILNRQQSCFLINILHFVPSIHILPKKHREPNLLNKFCKIRWLRGKRDGYLYAFWYPVGLILFRKVQRFVVMLMRCP